MKPRRYTGEQLEEAVKTSRSISVVLKKIGLTPAGGNYESIKKRIRKLNLDTSHFFGQAIFRGKTHTYNTRPCEYCKKTEWPGKPIPLELHHKDGDRTNNTLYNIELLCPNCHALIDNYRGSKKKV